MAKTEDLAHMRDEDLVQAFARHLESMGRYEMATIDTYVSDALRLAAYAARYQTRLYTLCAGDLDAWLRHLKALGMSLQTRARKFAAARALHRFLQPPNDWFDGVTRPERSLSSRRRRRAGPPVDQAMLHLCARDLSAASSTPSPHRSKRCGPSTEQIEARDQAIALLMARVGLSVSSVVELTLDAVLERVLRVQTVDQPMDVTLDSQTADALSRWLAVRPRVDSPWLFVSRRGSLTRQGVWKSLRARARSMGVDPASMTPRALRNHALQQVDRSPIHKRKGLSQPRCDYPRGGLDFHATHPSTNTSIAAAP